MNIAIVTTEFVSETNFHGGLANYTYKLSKWLIQQNHFVKVYIPQSENEINKTDVELIYEGIPLCKVTVDDYSWKLGYYLKRLKLDFLYSKKNKYYLQFYQTSHFINTKIKQDHLKLKFDIIHYPHLGGLSLRKPKNIPAVVRISSSTAMCQIMGGYGEDELKIKIQEQLEYKAMKRANAVFGPSIRIAQETEKFISKKVSVIETPFIMPIFSDDCVFKSFLAGKKYILFFGSIGLIKGVGTIADMIYPLLDFDKELHYVFVGKKLENEFNGMPVWNHLVDRAGAYSNRLIYFDSLKHDKLFPIIQGAQLVTLPSRVDNFPNTCIEAMANGKIVIGTYGNGFEQLIDDGINGFLINVDDHDDLLRKIKQVLQLSESQKNNIQSQAKKRIESLSPSIVLKQLVEYYKQTIKGNN